ncbi:hypothetical protein ACE6H2_019563 [Prunus campanulata]
MLPNLNLNISDLEMETEFFLGFKLEEACFVDSRSGKCKYILGVSSVWIGLGLTPNCPPNRSYSV